MGSLRATPGSVKQTGVRRSHLSLKTDGRSFFKNGRGTFRDRLGVMDSSDAFVTDKDTDISTTARRS